MASIAPSSQSVYKRAWQLFRQCALQLKIHLYSYHTLPMAVPHLASFVAFLSLKGFAPSTLISYTSAIGYVHRLAAVPDTSSSFLVQKMLAGASKLSPSLDSRLPITSTILARLIRAIPTTVSNSYNCHLLRAMLVIAFHGLMRIGELTSSLNNPTALNLDQLQFFPDKIVLTIRQFKHNLMRQPLEIVMPRQADPDICPVHAKALYIKVRGYASGPLFCFPNNSPISRSFFTSNLKSLISFIGFSTFLFKSHSLRIGGASHYASLGYSDAPTSWALEVGCF